MRCPPTKAAAIAAQRPYGERASPTIPAQTRAAVRRTASFTLSPSGAHQATRPAHTACPEGQHQNMWVVQKAASTIGRAPPSDQQPTAHVQAACQAPRNLGKEVSCHLGFI